MKRIGWVFLAEVALTGVLVTLAAAQSESLGDYARSIKKGDKKESAKKYDNDNLPVNDKISVVGPAPESTGAEDANPGSGNAGAANSGSTGEANSTKPADSSTTVTPEAQPQDSAKKAADEQKANDEWKQKFAGQKTKVDLLSRELDVAQREYRLRAAAFYADAGNRLRNQGSWDKEDAQYKKDIAQKQKNLDDAKKALSDLQEQGRRAGVPARDRE